MPAGDTVSIPSEGYESRRTDPLELSNMPWLSGHRASPAYGQSRSLHATLSHTLLGSTACPFKRLFQMLSIKTIPLCTWGTFAYFSKCTLNARVDAYEGDMQRLPHTAHVHIIHMNAGSRGVGADSQRWVCQRRGLPRSWDERLVNEDLQRIVGGVQVDRLS